MGDECVMEGDAPEVATLNPDTVALRSLAEFCHAAGTMNVKKQEAMWF